MPERRQTRTKARPSAEFGKRAIELAAAVGKSKHDLARAAGYTGGPKDPTIDRLARGEGSFLLAVAVKRALKGWGVDITLLPALDGEDEEADMPEWKREWLEVGEQLQRVASDKRFRAEIARVRRVIEAHVLVAEGTGDSQEPDER